MKRLMIIALMFISTAVFAAQRFVAQNNPCIFKSSYTATADTAKYIPASKYLARIVVSSATAGGWLKVYDSTWTAAGQCLPVVDLGTLGVYDIGIVATNGITYSTSGNSNGVSLIYREAE